MSHIYRAYYAIQGLTDQSGNPTNAVYGFTNMLRKLINSERPEYLGVAIDLPGPTIRHKQFKEYKATRRPTPPELLSQIPRVLEVCRVLRVPILSLEEYEADDVIGTIAKKAVAAGLQVVIVSIDKDMYQLVNSNVTILDPKTLNVLGSEDVEKKFGVAPNLVIDVLSLVGDSSDNVPGAPGIGMKGAQKLIQQFGSLVNLLDNRDKVTHKTYQSSLKENEKQILVSRDLVTIHQDLAIELDLDELLQKEPDKEAALNLFTELRFLSLLEEFIPAERSQEAIYETISQKSQLEALKAKIKSASIALYPQIEKHPETGKPQITGLGFSLGKHNGYSVENDFLETHRNALIEVLSLASCWSVHNLKPFLDWLRNHQLDNCPKLLDSMLMAYLVSPNSKDFSLEKMCLEHLQYRFSDSEEQQCLFSELQHRELAERADLTLQLATILTGKLEKLGLQQLLNTIELPLIEVLSEMENKGFLIDKELLLTMSEKTGLQIEKLKESIFSMAGQEFNINSPKQLAKILFETMSLPTPKKTRKAGHYATGAAVLEELAKDHPVAPAILEFRELSKLKNTYLDALPRLTQEDSKRVHTSYNQMVTATGRLSSSNPNLQNIPIRTELGREIRKAFIAPPGYKILAADYSQIELRVMAHLSSDPVLLNSFARDEDIHFRTALEVFGKEAVSDQNTYRRRAKAINFGVMYGQSAFGLSKTLKINKKEAQSFIDGYFAQYQGVQAWIERTIQQARDEGYVSTLFGRIRPIPEINSSNWNLRSFGERTAINAPIQGTAADLIKLAMIEIRNQLQQTEALSTLILQVHDELIFEAAEDELEELEKLVKQAMESVFELSVPLKVDIGSGSSWYDAK